MMDHDRLLNPTARSLQPSGIRKFFDILDTLDDVISLTVGEPDFVTPWSIREAGIYSLEQGRTHYTSNAGLLTLRQEIAKYLHRRFQLEYDPNHELIVTVGGSEGVDLALRTLLRPGDEVVIHEPNFVCYVPLIQLNGGTPVVLETRAEDDFRMTPQHLLEKLTPRTKAVILSYPNNPTGAVMERKDLESIAEILREREIYVISDEIYAELTYTDQGHVSIASLPDMRERTIVVSGFSKAYAMTGWRLGYTAAPEAVSRQMLKIHQYAVMCPPTTSQYGAIEALRNCQAAVGEMVTEYNRRRHLITEAFRGLGLPCFEPYGAFYIFPDIRRFGMSSEEFCADLLRQQHVALVPGTAFGRCGEGFARVSYAYSVKNINEAIRRIKLYMEERASFFDL